MWDGITYTKNVDQNDSVVQAFVEDLVALKSLLREQDKKYFSLSTVSFHDGVYKVWLNPDDQIEYNCGWYTIDELMMWLEDEGPVIKEQ